MENARALITTKNVDTMVKTVPNRTNGRIVTMLSGLMTESVIYQLLFLSKYLQRFYTQPIFISLLTITDVILMAVIVLQTIETLQGLVRMLLNGQIA